ncbi:hypothetical protein CK203_070009 [Vitis vinifera]|uniref:DDE Tnp4 domain-containing protein n=2 Tax=Vitis vinifera TaxID=29760 RepID=A0A438EQ39_VITVI|nr:hypothetical protein CK203_070009 [Vitis vinifera]
MDQSFLLMLSNLLHLHNHLDPTTTSLLSDTSTATTTATTSPTSPTSLLSSTSAAPLLFFTIASVLSYVASSRPSSSSSTSAAAAAAAPNPANTSSTSDYSVSAFRALSTEHIWAMEAPLRDAQWRSLYGLSYPVFTTVVDKLKPYIALSNLSLPRTTPSPWSSLASPTASPPKPSPLATRSNPTSSPRSPTWSLASSPPNFTPNSSKFPSVAAVSTKPPKPLKSSPPSPTCAAPSTAVPSKFAIILLLLIGAPGGTDDATHLRDSLLYNRLTSGDIVWDKVINVRNHHVRPYIVGDWCYPLLSFLLTPFSPSGSGTSGQNLFDAALMKGRSVVVEAIGLLKGRWRILQDLNVGMNHAPQTIVACCVLHNLCQIAREPEPDLWKEPEESGPPPRVLESEKSAYFFSDNLRQTLADDLHQRLSSR